MGGCVKAIGQVVLFFISVWLIGSWFEPFAPHKGGGTIIGVIVALVGIAIYQYVIAGNRRRDAESRETALVTRREEQINAPLQVIHVDGVVRKPSEMFYASEEAEVISEHSHSHHIGGYGGISVPIGHGVRVNTGRSRGRSVQTTAVEVDDRGMLYVSDQRVLFVGVRHTIEIPLSKIVSLKQFTDGLQIDRANAKSIVLRTEGLAVAVVLARILAGERPGASSSAGTVQHKVYGQEVTPAPSALETQVCPHCASDIPKIASVCRYCQRDVVPA